MSVLLLVNINAQPVCTLVERQPEQACNHQVEIERNGAINKPRGKIAYERQRKRRRDYRDQDADD